MTCTVLGSLLPTERVFRRCHAGGNGAGIATIRLCSNGTGIATIRLSGNDMSIATLRLCGNGTCIDTMCLCDNGTGIAIMHLSGNVKVAPTVMNAPQNLQAL